MANIYIKLSIIINSVTHLALSLTVAYTISITARLTNMNYI